MAALPIPATLDVQKTYWVFAIIALVLGAIAYVYMFIKLHSSKVKNGFMYFAFFPVFASDLLLIVNFVPRDFYHLATGKIEESAWCGVSAFLAVAGIFSLNTSMVTIAYMTRELVADRLNKDRSRSIMLKSCAFGWLVGIVFAAILAGSGQLGSFRGLYCCIETPGEGGNFVPYFFITLTAFSSMVYFYRQANAIAEEKWQLSAASRRKRAKDADADAKTNRPAQVQEVVVLAVWTTGTFYVLWFLVSLLGFVMLVKVTNYPAELDAIAGVVLKLQPLCNALILIRSIMKTKA